MVVVACWRVILDILQELVSIVQECINSWRVEQTSESGIRIYGSIIKLCSACIFLILRLVASPIKHSILPKVFYVSKLAKHVVYADAVELTLIVITEHHEEVACKRICYC